MLKFKGASTNRNWGIFNTPTKTKNKVFLKMKYPTMYKSKPPINYQKIQWLSKLKKNGSQQ